MIPAPPSSGVTMFEKIWSRHRIVERPDGQVPEGAAMEEGAVRIEQAVRSVLREGYRTADIFQPGMRRAGTEELGDAVAKAIRHSG
jgi:Isocitrate/isopropylmalate dehydrogenase